MQEISRRLFSGHRVGLGLIASGILLAAQATPAAANTLNSGPGMTNTRMEFTATVLHDGRLLVAGGAATGPTPVPSAALYSPHLNTWANTESMGTARFGHTATLLPNGKVLVAGGYQGTTFYASAELYDPSTDTWNPVPGSMQVARRYHTATLMNNGLVLLAGGSNGGAPSSAVDLYDPATNAFTSSTPISVPRDRHTAILLPNGNVFVYGGHLNGTALGVGEIYSPSTGTWSSLGASATSRWSHTATLLNSGKVLIAGGENALASTAAVEIFDPAIGTISTNAAPNQLVQARARHTATLLSNGKVLFAGGYSGSTLSSLEIYDPATNTSTAFGTAMFHNRANHTAALLSNNRVFIAGGYTGTIVSGTTTVFDSTAYAWTPTGATPSGSPFTGRLVVHLQNGKILAAGGTTSSSFVYTSSTASHEYDPVAGTWSASSGTLVYPRHGAGSVLLSDGRVLAFGGMTDQSTPTKTAELYNPTTRTWSATSPMNSARLSGKGVLLPNGRVLVAGGVEPAAGGGTAAATAEIYDPVKGAWSATGALPGHRTEFTMNVLPDGRVLVAGGRSGPSMTVDNTAYLYDPGVGTWTQTGSMTNARVQHASALLPTGRVVVISGAGTKTTELYNPATGTWSMAGQVATERQLALAGVMPSGRVLLVPQADTPASAITTEVFDPVSSNWRPGPTFTPSVPQAGIYSDSLISLRDGRLLLSGLSYTDGGAFTLISTLCTENHGATAPTLPIITAASLDTDTRYLTLTGSGFIGLQGGSNGGYRDSAANTAIAQWRNVSSNETITLPVIADSLSSGSLRAGPVPAFMGNGVVSVIVKGVPSPGILVPSNALSPLIDTDGDGMSDLAEWEAEDYGLRFLHSQPAEVAKFNQIAAHNGMVTQEQYIESREDGRNDVINDPNTYDLYSSDQIQALHVNTPLIKREATTGKFTLTLGIGKTTLLGTIPFTPFPFSNTGGSTITINGAGQLEFTFPATEDAAFYRIETRK
jgi:N-acetylneuraminic acid mutarotase